MAEILFSKSSVFKTNSTFASASVLGNTKSTVLPSDSKLEELPVLRSFSKLVIKLSTISNIELLFLD